MSVHQFLVYFAFPALVFVSGIVYLYVIGKLDDLVRATVPAVYRVAIHEAEQYCDEGIAWLRGPEGVAYRKRLADQAYDCLPATIGPVPVGAVKAFVSREQWCAWVQQAFEEMAEWAAQIELPLEVVVTWDDGR